MKYLQRYSLFTESNSLESLKVNSDGEYHLIPFSLFKDEVCITGIDNYVLCFSNNFVYDYITDDDITKSLNLDLSGVDITKDWASVPVGGKYEYEHAKTNKDRHTHRIAKLVNEIKSGTPITPISLCFDEQSYMHDIPNYIEDGNHRIRALQYLGYEYFPAYVYGSFTTYLLEYLKSNNLNESVEYFQEYRKLQQEIKTKKDFYQKKIEDCFLYLTDDKYVLNYEIHMPDESTNGHYRIEVDIDKITQLEYEELIDLIKRCIDKLKHDLNAEDISLYCRSEGAKTNSAITSIVVNEENLEDIYSLDGKLVKIRVYFK